MLHHRLARTEGAGDGGGAAFRHGEEGVHDPLAGLEGDHRGILVLIGTAHTDRPFLHHGQLMLLALFVHQDGDLVQHGVGAGLNGLNGTAHFGRDHNLVEDGVGLLNGADDVAADHLVAGLDSGVKIPFLIPVQGGNLHTAGQVVPFDLPHDDLQRALDAVVDVLDQAGAQLHRKGGAGSDHIGARAQARGLLIDLDRGGAAGHGEDLADQTLLAHTDHVGHVGLLHAGGHHQRAGDLNDFSHRLSRTFFLGSFRVYPLRPPVPRRS